jgi:methionine-rich copper-binding protein CopC
MKGITWSRDSHGLFDYESRHLTKKTLKTDEAVMIMRTNNELRAVPYNMQLEFSKQVQASQADDEDRCLLKIVNHNESTFYLESAALTQEQTLKMDVVPQGRSNLNENMYLVVRSIKHNNEKIVSGD